MSNETVALKEELKQIQLAYQMAAQMSQFKAGFLARTAHELRSPISSLIGLHQLILCDLCNSPEEEREFLAQAYQSAQKLMNIIDEIIAISKVEFGTNHTETQPLQLSGVFDEVYRLIHLQVANRNLQLKISSPDSALYVIADRRRLLQVLVNLIDIAIVHTEEDSILISADSYESPDSTQNSAGGGSGSRFEQAQINVLIRCPVSILSEPINLLQQTPDPSLEATKAFSRKLELSPGMKFWLAQTLLEAMQGHLEVSEISSDGNAPLIRLQCSLPRLPAGTEQKVD